MLTRHGLPASAARAIRCADRLGHQHRQAVRLVPNSSPSSGTVPGAAPFVQPDDLISPHRVEEVDVFDTGFEKSQRENKVARPTTRFGAREGTAVGERFV